MPSDNFCGELEQLWRENCYPQIILIFLQYTPSLNVDPEVKSVFCIASQFKKDKLSERVAKCLKTVQGRPL